jgi:3-oxoacyl-[acyl-carrier-protein] synthase III
MGIRGARIYGLGSYAPDRILTNADLEKMIDTTDEWIVSHTGIRERHIAADDQAASDLGLIAAERAIAAAGIAPTDLGLVIVATVTGDHIFPATACVIQDRIGATNAGAFDLGVGCTGFINAVAVASQFVAAGTYDYVLVIAAEVLSRITNWADRSTCVLFGDGAGAVVVGPAEEGAGILSFVMQSFGEYGSLLTVPVGGSRRACDAEAIAQHLNTLHMEGHEVFKLAVRGTPDVAEQALSKAGVDAHEISWIVMHQANLRIMDAAARKLDIPDERVYVNIDRYGNTSGASIPLALDEMQRDGKLKPGDLLLLIGFGAGFSLASMVIRWG